MFLQHNTTWHTVQKIIKIKTEIYGNNIFLKIILLINLPFITTSNSPFIEHLIILVSVSMGGRVRWVVNDDGFLLVGFFCRSVGFCMLAIIGTFYHSVWKPFLYLFFNGCIKICNCCSNSFKCKITISFFNSSLMCCWNLALSNYRF